VATSIVASRPITAEVAPGPAPAPSPSASPDRRFLLLVGAAVLAGLALRVAIGLTDDAPTTDETAYLSSGISLVDGGGFMRGTQPELHFPPFVPFLLGAAGRVFADPHTGTVWLTILAGSALVVPLALLSRRVAGPAAGIATAWVAALAPGLATTPAARGAGSEAVYSLLLVTAVWLVVGGADGRGRTRLARVCAVGLLVGLAYLTRPEGLFVAVPLGVAVVVLAGRGVDGGGARRRRRLCSAVPLAAGFAAPLVVCIVPYAMFLHHHTGRWQLTAKTQDASIEAWHAVARNDREARDEVLYALDDSGLRFVGDRSPLPTLARDDPLGYGRIVGANVLGLGKNVVGWWLLPLPVWCLAGVGAWRWRRSQTVVLLLAVAALPVATALAFFVQPRYLVVTVAAASVFVGTAVPTLAPRRNCRPVMAAVLALLVLSSFAAFRGAGGWWHPADHTDQRGAGEWIAAHTDPDDVVMTRSFVVDHYAHRPTLAIPYAELDQILRFARHYGAQYLVADWFTTGTLRPQLALLREQDRVPGLRLVHEVRAEGRTTRIFVLDPAPPPTAEVGPSLGFMGDGLA
jgi:hypothetical protein